MRLFPPLRLMLLIAACSLLSCAVRPDPPEVQLQNLRIGELTLSHANLLATLRIFNPNSVPLTVQGVDYAFFLNGIQVADGRAQQPVRVGAGEYGEAVLRLSAGYLNLLQLTSALQPEEQLKYALEGSVRIGGFRILNQTFPFRREGVIDPKLLPIRSR
ncbi:MAG: LEA type 2 family protein [Desulfuromonadales bacterium]|nr:LEA type 2 family protein [Desulfuromonadales bacterium]